MGIWPWQLVSLMEVEIKVVLDIQTQTITDCTRGLDSSKIVSKSSSSLMHFVEINRNGVIFATFIFREPKFFSFLKVGKSRLIFIYFYLFSALWDEKWSILLLMEMEPWTPVVDVWKVAMAVICYAIRLWQRLSIFTPLDGSAGVIYSCNLLYKIELMASDN